MNKHSQDLIRALEAALNDEGPFTFSNGTRVRKGNGYPFEGVVEASWMATQFDGTAVERCAVNLLGTLDGKQVLTGMTHIFRPDQLIPATIPPEAYSRRAEIPSAAPEPEARGEIPQTSLKDNRPFYYVADVVREWGIPATTLNNAALNKKLKSRKIGRKRAFLRADLEAWIEKGLDDGSLLLHRATRRKQPGGEEARS